MAQAQLDEIWNGIAKQNEMVVNNNIKIQVGDKGETITFYLKPQVEGITPEKKLMTVFMFRKLMNIKDKLNEHLDRGEPYYEKIYHPKKYGEVKILSGGEKRVGVYFRNEYGVPTAHNHAKDFSEDDWKSISKDEVITWVELQAEKGKLKKEAMSSKKKQTLDNLKRKLPLLEEQVQLFTWKCKDISPSPDNKYFYKEEHARQNALMDPKIQEDVEHLKVFSVLQPPVISENEFLEFCYAFCWAKGCVKFLSDWKKKHGVEMQLTDEIMDNQVEVPDNVIYTLYVQFVLNCGLPVQFFWEKLALLKKDELQLKGLAIDLFYDLTSSEVKPHSGLYMICDDMYKHIEQGNIINAPPKFPSIDSTANKKDSPSSPVLPKPSVSCMFP